MLGRYVAGTLMILGAAMVIAPDAPKENEAQVTRADTSTMALASTAEAQPVRLIEDAPTEPALAAPAEISVGTVTVSAQDSDRIDAAAASVTEDRVNVTLSDTQIGGIATLAGLAPAPQSTTDVSAPEPAPTDTVVSSPVVTANVGPDYLYVTGNRVNVRSGPSTDFRVIGRAVYGDSVEILSRDGQGWAEIRLLGTDDIGYMSVDFLAEELNG